MSCRFVFAAIGVLLISGCEAVQVIDARGNNNVCPVHHVAMNPRTVPVFYGLPYYPDGYLEAQQEGFPNAMSGLCGGCNPGPPRAFILWHCIGCERARLTWYVEHDEPVPEGVRYETTDDGPRARTAERRD